MRTSSRLQRGCRPKNVWPAAGEPAKTDWPSGRSRFLIAQRARKGVPKTWPIRNPVKEEKVGRATVRDCYWALSVGYVMSTLPLSGGDINPKTSWRK